MILLAAPSRSMGAQVSVVALQAQYDPSPDPRRYQLWLGAGPAVVRHGGGAYRSYGAPTSAGGAAGVGITRPVGARVRLAAGVTMPPELRGNAGSLERGFQTDALVQLGVRWRPW